MIGDTAKACFAVCFLFAVSNPLADAFPISEDALIHIQQNNAINAITDAITVSHLLHNCTF